jgi:hypothetical protein
MPAILTSKVMVAALSALSFLTDPDLHNQNLPAALRHWLNTVVLVRGEHQGIATLKQVSQGCFFALGSTLQCLKSPTGSELLQHDVVCTIM